MTREELKNMWVKNMEVNEQSEGTIKEYTKHLNCFFDFIGDKELKDVVKFDVNMFRNDNPNLSKSYRNIKLSAVKSFFDFLVNDIEYLDNNVAIGVKPYKLKEDDTKEKFVLTDMEKEWIIKASKNTRDKAIVSTLLYLGLRVSELIDITLDDYCYAKEHDGELRIKKGKGNKFRVVYINDKLFNIIDAYLPNRKESEENNLFISNGKKPMDRSCMSRTLKCLARRSGHFTEERVSEIHNHLMRHTCLTNYSEAGVDIETISAIAGHSSVAVTSKVYVHVNNNRIKNAMNVL